MGTARDLPKQHPEKKYFGQLWGWFHPCISFCHSNWPAVPFLGFFWFGVWLFACFPLALVVFGFLSCLSCWLLFCLPDYQFTMKPRAVHSLACVFCHDTSISHQFTFPAHGLPVILDIGRSQRRKKNCCVDSSSFMFSYGSADWKASGRTTWHPSTNPKMKSNWGVPIGLQQMCGTKWVVIVCLLQPKIILLRLRIPSKGCFARPDHRVSDGSTVDPCFAYCSNLLDSPPIAW